ncbi:MAG: T9SS type A sorting domain-containing protein [Bacteroidota bacterium]
MNAQGLVIEEDLILKDAPVPSIVEFADLQEASLAVSAADEIAIYPNPAKSGDFVTIEGTQKIYTILLMDSNAKVLAKWKDGRDTKVRIALPQLRSGMYFISVGTKEGVFTESLSIQ